MNISKRRYRSFQSIHFLGPVQRAAVGVVAVLSLLAAGWGGYEIGRQNGEVRQAELAGSVEPLREPEPPVPVVQRCETYEQLDALARRLGEMQAELLRLDALGERLVEIGGLDTDEFDFSEVPPMGGPDSTDDVSMKPTEIMADLEWLARKIEDRDVKLGLLEDLLLSRQVREEAEPAGRPVASGFVSSRFGWRSDPITGRKSLHKGLDFAGKHGSDIIAVADGLVSRAGWRGGYGRTVEIRHGNGYLTRYAHNSELLVKKGDLVKQGQVIAKMGRTGRVTGVHLHFEVLRDGKAVNPLRFVKRDDFREDNG
jgi:murein DD-endopeptidase MepM/ murein hydrolase activator NlpD